MIKSSQKLIEELRTEYYDSIRYIKEIDDFYTTENDFNIDSKRSKFEVLLKKFKNEEFLICGKIMKKITTIQEFQSNNPLKFQNPKKPKQYLIIDIEDLHFEKRKKIIISNAYGQKFTNTILEENKIYIINKLKLKIYKTTEIVYTVSMKTNYRRINEDIYNTNFKLIKRTMTTTKTDKFIPEENKLLSTCANNSTTCSSIESIIIESSSTNNSIEKLKSLAISISNYEIDFKKLCNKYQGVPIDTLLRFQEYKLDFKGVIENVKIIPDVKKLK